MTPFRNADERIWRAITGLRAEYVDPSRMTVHVHPGVLYEMKTDPYVVRWIDPSALSKVFGLPVEPDPRLRDGEIVLRYEVSA